MSSSKIRLIFIWVEAKGGWLWSEHSLMRGLLSSKHTQNKSDLILYLITLDRIFAQVVTEETN